MLNDFTLSLKQKRFVESDSDFTMYGGGAASGATFALLNSFDKVTQSSRGVMLAEGGKRIWNTGGLFDTALKLYDEEVSEFSKSGGIIRFHSGAELNFMTFDRLKHTGLKFSFIGIEQVQSCDKHTFIEILSSLKTNGKIYATVLPDNESLIFDLIRDSLDEEGVPVEDEYFLNKVFTISNGDVLAERTLEIFSKRFKRIDSEKILTFRFIPANVFDNLYTDQFYISCLHALPAYDRKRLLHGSWF